MQGSAKRLKSIFANHDDEDQSDQRNSRRHAQSRLDVTLPVIQIPSRFDEPVGQKDRREDDGGDHRSQANLGVCGEYYARHYGCCYQQPEDHLEVLHGSSGVGVLGASVSQLNNVLYYIAYALSIDSNTNAP